jgi:tetraacyldisaccharide 4'-kinase
MSIRNSLAIAGSGLLELVNTVAYQLYRNGWRKRFRASVPVISVGNIALGGTGKTPLVAALARVLLAAGARPAILTRGYRRTSKEPVLLWREQHADWESAGDEPLLLARALPDVPVMVDADRVRSAEEVVRRTLATHLILDDGFQHWRLERDLDIVIVDAADPIGANIPRREPPSALARAHGIVINRAIDRSVLAAALAVVGAEAPDAVLVATTVAASAVHLAGERQSCDILKGRRVVAMAGLASPDPFVNSLGDLGAHLVDVKVFPDHYRYSRREVETILAEAEQADATLVTTGKDVVKLPRDLLARVAWLEIELKPVWGTFEQLLAPVLERLGSVVRGPGSDPHPPKQPG